MFVGVWGGVGSRVGGSVAVAAGFNVGVAIAARIVAEAVAVARIVISVGVARAVVRVGVAVLVSACALVVDTAVAEVEETVGASSACGCSVVGERGGRVEEASWFSEGVVAMAMGS
jgi:hypothetical protein